MVLRCRTAVKLNRLASLVDVVVAALVAFVVLLPPRAVKAKVAAGGDDDARLALAFAQARATVRPDDAALTADLSRRLGEVGFFDWAVQEAAVGAARMGEAPGRWRALLATSIAHADRLEAKEALDYTNQALLICGHGGDAVCSPMELVRLELYQVHAVTEGTDAQAEVSVRLADKGDRTVTARGADPDTLVASAKAYLGALNKLTARRHSGLAVGGRRRIHSTDTI